MSSAMKQPGTHSPHMVSTTLAAFVDTLIPGDDLFPPASAVGVHGWLSETLHAVHGPASIDALVAALTPVGRIEAERGLRLLGVDGDPVPVPGGSYRHFALAEEP